jgi:hypothetical protein
VIRWIWTCTFWIGLNKKQGKMKKEEKIVVQKKEQTMENCKATRVDYLSE